MEPNQTEGVVKNKGGRRPGSRNKPKIDLVAALDTPEGKKMFQDAIAQALGNVTARGDEPKADGETMIRALAHELAAIGDQGVGKIKRLSADEIEKRGTARTEMQRLIDEAKELALDFDGDDINPHVPTYDLNREVYLEEQLVAATYIDNTHITRRTRIAWPGIPNEAMAPVNALARAIYKQFIVSIGGNTPMYKADTEVVKSRRTTGLSVMHKSELEQQAPHVGKPRMQNEMKILRRNDPDQVVETRVLGSVAEPARQLA